VQPQQLQQQPLYTASAATDSATSVGAGTGSTADAGSGLVSALQLQIQELEAKLTADSRASDDGSLASQALSQLQQLPQQQQQFAAGAAAGQHAGAANTNAATAPGGTGTVDAANAAASRAQIEKQLDGLMADTGRGHCRGRGALWALHAAKLLLMPQAGCLTAATAAAYSADCDVVFRPCLVWLYMCRCRNRESICH
jgi:hypothetical protein